MGKKAKTKTGKVKASNRKLDKATLPPPPAPVTDELGSAKLLDEPKPPGSLYKALDQDGYDDGGVADLTLVIDLEDSVLRRRKGENAYFSALKADLLPRVNTGKLTHVPRREQKIKLAKMLFSGADGEDDQDDEKNQSEVWIDSVDGFEDEATKKQRKDRLDAAKSALRLSSILRESACASLSLAEISKRYLALKGKDGGEDALRCVRKAIEVASDGFYDNDDIAIEANEEPKIDPKYEKNATYPGLGNPATLKLQPIRVSHLCLRSAYLHEGNALSALGRNEEAREVYEKVLPMLAKEPRSIRVDWERSSIIVNMGNTFSRDGDFESADVKYREAEQLGKDHLEVEDGNKAEGMGIMLVAIRARALALKRAGRDDEAKKLMKEVIEMQMKVHAEEKKQQEKEKEMEEALAAAAAQPAQ